jgi:FkbM family methyltransferase
MNSNFILPVDPNAIPPDFVFPQAVKNVSSGLKLLSFPGGFTCYTHTTAEEAATVYNEIIVKGDYYRYGLSVAGARCVFDVGANIGIFTLSVKMIAPEATVYAFEPIQDTFRVLEENVRFHGYTNVHSYNVAIGSQDNIEKTFTYYPNMSVDASAVPAIREEQKPMYDQFFGKELSDYLHISESRVAKVRTLSSIIQERSITSIDYLKIDVEGDEMAVLEGITEPHWPMVRQVVVEAHNERLREQVHNYLAARNFKIYEGTNEASMMGVINVYALRD